MLLIHHLNFADLERQFEKRDDLVIHELRCNRTTTHVGVFLLYEADILRRLDDADLIFAAFGLAGDDEVAPALSPSSWPRWPSPAR